MKLFDVVCSIYFDMVMPYKVRFLLGDPVKNMFARSSQKFKCNTLEHKFFSFCFRDEYVLTVNLDAGHDLFKL